MSDASQWVVQYADAITKASIRIRALGDLQHDDVTGQTDVLHATLEVIDHADRLLQHVVDELRRRRWTWEQIGSRLGMTRQSAWERFGPLSEDAPPDPG